MSSDLGVRKLRLFFFFRTRGSHRDLHSFPTRRSSDLPRTSWPKSSWKPRSRGSWLRRGVTASAGSGRRCGHAASRSEEHTSELQSHVNLVCRLLLEKKKTLNKLYDS